MERASNLGSIFAGGFGSCFSLSSFVKKCEECVFFFTEVLRETNEPCESVCLVNPCMIGRPMSLWS